MKQQDARTPTRYAAAFASQFIPKYLRGRREHKTKLTSRNLLPHAEEEVLDLWAYLQGMRDQRHWICWQLESALQHLDNRPTKAAHHIESALNTLVTGNAQGLIEGIIHPEEEEE